MTRAPRTADVVPGLQLDVAGFGGVDIDAAFAALRREAPVSRYEPGRFWAVMAHRDVQAISQNPETFSSAHGVMIGDQLDAARLDRGGSIAEGSEHLLETDPPRHRLLRRLVGGSFTPAAMGTFEDRIRKIVVDTLASVDISRPVDFVDAIATPIPVVVIAEMLGVPPADWRRFREWTDAMVVLLQADVTPEDAAAAGAKVGELNQYLGELLAQRANDPGDDLITQLLQAEVDGESLSPLTAHSMCVAFLIAGNETTRSLMSGGVRVLAENGDARRKLAADPARIRSAVEELLRWVSPITAFMRMATRDAVVAGYDIPAGDYVAMFYRSANRDEDVWPDAATFNPQRAPDPAHLAFGWGEHLCIGAHLARLETRLLFEELLARFPDFELAGEPQAVITPLSHATISLPVSLR